MCHTLVSHDICVKNNKNCVTYFDKAVEYVFLADNKVITLFTMTFFKHFFSYKIVLYQKLIII